MKRWLSLGLLLMAAPTFAARYALLVGVDNYGFINDSLHQLQGAETDTGLMKKMLALYGFDTTVLLRSDASRKRIVEELAKVEGRARRDDEVVFYFSGRGSIAPDIANPGAKVGFEPTLVPSDGSATSLDPDIRMRRIEEWAKTLDAKGAHATIILDASFQNPARSDYGRQYNPTPRSVRRASTADAEVRDAIYVGPGTFISACPAKGSAYEWLVSQDRWGGAFTDQFVNAVVAGMNRGENPTILDAMREVQAYFKDKVRSDYMPGLSPFPTMEALMADARYGEPFVGGVDVASLPPDSKAAVAAMDRIKQERERKFRVAIEVTDAANEAQRKQAYDKCSKDLTAFLQKLPNAAFAPEGSPPDVIIRIKPSKAKLDALVTGDDVDKAKAYTFTGKDFRKALDSGLGGYLELRSLVARLYRLTATESPTWHEPLSFSGDAVAYSRGDNFGIDLAAPDGALLFVLDRDDSDGILQLAFPQVGAPYHQKISGPLRLGAQIQNDTSTGRMMVRAIVVPSMGKPTLPEVQMADEKTFRDALLRQLRLVVPALESKQLPWAAKTINLRIR